MFGRANNVVWDFIPGCLLKVVGCCAGFYVVVRGLCANNRM